VRLRRIRSFELERLYRSAFVGSGSFTDSTISGSITLFGTFDSRLGQPPFPITIDYTGTGVLKSTPTRTIFTVTSPVPEPGALLFFGTGLAGAVAVVRRRRGSHAGSKQEATGTEISGDRCR
jgi:hypothetical protein